MLWIKPSGVSLASITVEDLVPLDLQVLLNRSLARPDPDPSLGDPVNQIAGLARRDDGPRRPSVEILFHALIPDTFVFHTHPLLINAITCNADGAHPTAEMFGNDVLWVSYVDPGLPLAREIAARREDFTSRTGQPPPKATFLMNHGLIVASDNPDDVRAESYRILARIEEAVASASADEPSTPSGADLGAVAEAFRAALGAVAVATDEGGIARGLPATEAGARIPRRGPADPGPDRLRRFASARGDHCRRTAGPAGRAFREARGVDPVIVVAPGPAWPRSATPRSPPTTALQVYVDALTVGRAATALGRVRALNEAERRFIETWEAEAYRQQVAKA